MLKHITLVLLGSVLGCVACGSATDEPVQLTDPESGELVGQTDPATGDYLFSNGDVVARADIEQVSESEWEKLWEEKTQGKLFHRPYVMKSPSSHGSSFGSGSGAGSGAGGGCWSMSEGGASCTGCCTQVGPDTFYCWESCTDIS